MIKEKMMPLIEKLELSSLQTLTLDLLKIQVDF